MKLTSWSRSLLDEIFYNSRSLIFDHRCLRIESDNFYFSVQSLLYQFCKNKSYDNLLHCVTVEDGENCLCQVFCASRFAEDLKSWNGSLWSRLISKSVCVVVPFSWHRQRGMVMVTLLHRFLVMKIIMILSRSIRSRLHLSLYSMNRIDGMIQDVLSLYDHWL